MMQVPATETATDYDVVIVGFGPVGAVGTCYLGQAGIRTLVVDKSTTIWQIPRAMAIDHEILRIFQNFGIADQVLPHTAPFPASEHFGAEGQLIRRIDVVDPPYPLGYVPTMVFTQPAVEAILRAQAEGYANVTVSLGVEVTAIAQTADHAVVHLTDSQGKQRTVSARYVIGCDGASSTVRRLMGIKLRDLGFDEPWLVVDVLVDERSLHKLPVTAAQYCNPERPTTFIVGPGNHRRWEIMLSPGEEPRESEQEENVWRLLSPWLTPADGTLWRASSYRFHALLAEQWREGRVFLAGDAAHQQPPFIGQGMCQGIRDVTNLCWKLREVLSGMADSSLLDTYETERKQHVYTLTLRIKAIGHHICERDPEAARLRDESLIAQGGGKAPTVTRQEIVPPLEVGFLADSTHAATGTLFPQPWIMTPKGPVHMDTIAGYGWRLVVDGRKITATPKHLRAGSNDAAIETVVIGGQGLHEKDGIVADWFDRHSAAAAIIRPDHYVYGIASNLSAAQELLNALLHDLLNSLITSRTTARRP